LWPATNLLAGSSQPTLEVIRKLATTLGVSSDQLLFDEGEHGADDDLEAISRFDEEEQRIVRSVLEEVTMTYSRNGNRLTL
jgi:transcriptional regulator with XRE-family HTH domain